MPLPPTGTINDMLCTETMDDDDVGDSKVDSSSPEVPEVFPDVTNLKLAPLPPPPPPPLPPSSTSLSSNEVGVDGVGGGVTDNGRSLLESEDLLPPSPPMQTLPPLPVSSCLTTPTSVAMATCTSTEIGDEVRRERKKKRDYVYLLIPLLATHLTSLLPFLSIGPKGD